MAKMFHTSPLRWKAPDCKDKLGRDTRQQYQFRITNAWFSIYRKYEKVHDSDAFELPANARRSRKQLHAKLNRYRMVGRKE